MVRSLEDIVGKIGREQVIPGTKPGNADEVRYVSFVRPSKPAVIFDEVAWKVDPPVVKSGGVSLANWIVTIPDGTPFFAVEYHDDVAGWQLQIERGAQKSGLLSAKIEGQEFALSDGRSFLLSECFAEYDPKISAI